MRYWFLVLLVFEFATMVFAEEAAVYGNAEKPFGTFIFSSPETSIKRCHESETCELTTFVPRGARVLVDNHEHIRIITGDAEADRENYSIKVKYRVGETWFEGYVPHNAIRFSSSIGCDFENSTSQNVQDIVEAVEQVQEEAQVQEQAEKQPKVDGSWWRRKRTCKVFIGKDGQMGHMGKKMNEAIKHHEAEFMQEHSGRKCFSADRTWRDICPGFKNFSKEKQAQFIAHLGGQMAYYESTCRKKITTKGRNDTAIGYFQLEDSFEQRMKRDKRYCPHVPTVMTNDDVQVNCALSIMRDTVCGMTEVRKNKYKFINPKDTTSESLKINHNVGYWHELRYNVGCRKGRHSDYTNPRFKASCKQNNRRRGKIYLGVKEFPGCEG